MARDAAGPSGRRGRGGVSVFPTTPQVTVAGRVVLVKVRPSRLGGGVCMRGAGEASGMPRTPSALMSHPPQIDTKGDH